MALKDIFKTKKEPSKKEEKEKKVVKKSVKKTVKKDVKKTVKKDTKKAVSKKVIKSKKSASEGFAYRILKFPHITEKATILAQNNQYTFIVYNDVNKIEIKKAVELLYSVKVIKIQIVKMPKKRIRVGKTFGWKKAYKKAIVRIKDGQKIEEMIR